MLNSVKSACSVELLASPVAGPRRVLIKLLIGLALATAAIFASVNLSSPPAEAQTYPASSCQPDTVGNDPCAGATGPIGAGSCNGDYACRNAAGPIGAGSCLGNSVCQDAGGAVGAGSCDGFEACYETGGDVGDGSCLGNEACNAAGGAVGDGSCVGSQACVDAVGSIGAGSCIGNEACNAAGGDVGDGSCLGDFACYATGGAVGAGSCVGNYACPGSSGPIGDCEFNSVDADCDGVASGVDCDDTDASVIIRCAPAAAYAGPFVVKPPVVEGLFGFGSAESVSAGGEAVAAAELVVAEAEAEPVLAFTGGTSDGAVLAGVLMLGLGFSSLAVQRRRRNSTFF